MRLGSLRTIGGRVVDRQGKPVAGVEVFQTADGPEPTATKSGPDGRFTLPGFRRGPVFLFARGDGFRFHGQLIRDGKGDVTVELTRTGEPPTRAMPMLTEPMPLEESRAMARRLVEPVWKVVVETGDDRTKYRTLAALVNADPAGVLEKLESARFSEKGPESRLRVDIVVAMAASDPEEALAVAEAIADPRVRAAAIIRAIDTLPDSQRGRKVTLLDRAALHARATPDPVQRLREMGDVAARLYDLGEVARSKALFSEAQTTANRLPDKTDTQRGAFAGQLALVDLPAAMAIARDFETSRTLRRSLFPLAYRLMEKDPAYAERIWKEFQGGVVLGAVERLCWKMATVDPQRAGGSSMLSHGIRTLGSASSWPWARGSGTRPRPGRRSMRGSAAWTGSCRASPNDPLTSSRTCCQPSSGSIRSWCPSSSGAAWPCGRRPAIRARPARIPRPS